MTANATPPASTIDRTAFSIARLGDEADRRAYWHSRTPHERLLHVELLRRLNHGSKATAGLQRVLEVARLTRVSNVDGVAPEPSQDQQEGERAA